ncbi:hypothetical protein OE88DRAFT_1649214 [Heliocybe sulcata]|uniref:Uncharacterized protein n=1 Tax=Heliocybe sulcata TaxID=5364 RepID=A0A5C3MLG9_9AGAM|nr:hypothetical protein OE88DRAFT_1649214 [Heliocybe sulcata]
MVPSQPLFRSATLRTPLLFSLGAADVSARSLQSAQVHVTQPVVLDYDVEGGLQEAQELAEERARRQEEGADGTVEEPSAEDDLRIIHDHRFHHGCTQHIPESVNVRPLMRQEKRKVHDKRHQNQRKHGLQELHFARTHWRHAVSIRSLGPPRLGCGYWRKMHALAASSLRLLTRATCLRWRREGAWVHWRHAVSIRSLEPPRLSCGYGGRCTHWPNIRTQNEGREDAGQGVRSLLTSKQTYESCSSFLLQSFGLIFGCLLSNPLQRRSTFMARTKQMARKAAGGFAPRKKHALVYHPSPELHPSPTVPSAPTAGASVNAPLMMKTLPTRAAGTLSRVIKAGPVSLVEGDWCYLCSDAGVITSCGVCKRLVCTACIPALSSWGNAGDRFTCPSCWTLESRCAGPYEGVVFSGKAAEKTVVTAPLMIPSQMVLHQPRTAIIYFRLSSIRSAGSPPPATYAYLETYYALSPDNLQFIEIDFSLPGNVSCRHKNALADARRTLEKLKPHTVLIFFSTHTHCESGLPFIAVELCASIREVFEAVIGDDLMDWISHNTHAALSQAQMACSPMYGKNARAPSRLRITDGFAFTGARFLMEEVTSFSIQFTQRIVVQGANTEKVLRTILNALHPLELRNDVIWFHTHPVDGQVKFRRVAYWTNLTSIFGTRVPMQCLHCFVLRCWRLEGKRNLFQGANTRIVCEVCKGAIAIDHPEYQRLPGTVEGEWVMQGPWRLE